MLICVTKRVIFVMCITNNKELIMLNLIKNSSKSNKVTSTVVEFAEILALWGVASAAVLLTSLLWVN